MRLHRNSAIDQMKWLQAIQQFLPQHKYAINAVALGDNAELPWTNLGYWNDATSSYPQACCQLADHLAQAIQLKADDRLLDLGCGQGASLQHWLEHYQIQDLEAVELQNQCVLRIKEKLPQLTAIHHQSFLNLNSVSFSRKFDAVMCIDAAYHCNLNSFLASVTAVLNSKARIGFHCLMLSDDWQTASTIKKLQYQALLKSADVRLAYLYNQIGLEQLLQQHGYGQIVIEDLSEPVLYGFSDYIFQKIEAVTELEQQNAGSRLDIFKIQMTARLCKKLYKDGLVRYVQVSAEHI